MVRCCGHLCGVRYCAKQDTTIRCCRYLFGTAVQSKIPQSGTMEMEDVAGLPFDVLAARIQPFNWEELFARIPIQEPKETKFVYDAQQTMDGYLPLGKGMTIQKMSDNHRFGHLIVENMKGIVGLTPVHVVHHIAYDNGDEASFIYQVLHVEEEDEEDKEDMEEDEEGDIKRPIPHTLLVCLTRIG